MKLNKNKKIVIILIGILIILVIINIIIKAAFKDTNELSPETILEKQETESKISKLSEEDETQRIEHYLSQFIEYIENKRWTQAYNLLYDEFKNNYFQTENSFQKYCEEYFPDFMKIDIDNIERLNNTYVLECKINDLINGNKKGKEIGIYFVIRENGLNDFDLSFSVDSAMNTNQ